MGGGRKENANALKYGVMVEGVLTSRGAKCVYRSRCAECFRSQCKPCEPCPYESQSLERYIVSAMSQFAYAAVWLGQVEIERRIRRLGVLSLQLGRLGLRIAQEETFDHCSPDVCMGRGQLLATTRYATALHRQQRIELEGLLDDETRDRWFTRH